MKSPDERYFALARQIWDRINARDFSVTDLAEALSDLRVQPMGHPQNQTHPTCKDCHDAGVNAARAAVYDYAGPTSPWHMDLMRRIDSALLGEYTEQPKTSPITINERQAVELLLMVAGRMGYRTDENSHGPNHFGRASVQRHVHDILHEQGVAQPPSDALYTACEELAVFGDYCGNWICKLCKAKAPGRPPAGYARKPFPHHKSCVLYRTAGDHRLG